MFAEMSLVLAFRWPCVNTQ